MSDILWPVGFVPGFTDNYVSNEVIVAGLTTAGIWPFLAIPSRWPDDYASAADVEIHTPGWPRICPRAASASRRRKPRTAPPRALAAANPNPMINGHQDLAERPCRRARKAKGRGSRSPDPAP